VIVAGAFGLVSKGWDLPIILAANYFPSDLYNLQLDMSPSSRRRSQRTPYYRRELVADFDSKSIPDLSDFHWVTFQNISDTGAAFLSSRKPATDKLVIVLSNGPSIIARVVRAVCRAESPELVFEIGCEFERRLSPSESVESGATESPEPIVFPETLPTS
jgi:hypothetical protein